MWKSSILCANGRDRAMREQMLPAPVPRRARDRGNSATPYSRAVPASAGQFPQTPLHRPPARARRTRDRGLPGRPSRCLPFVLKLALSVLVGPRYCPGRVAFCSVSRQRAVTLGRRTLQKNRASFYHRRAMPFPIRVCAVCGEEFELKPDKPGFANRCPSCSEPEEADTPGSASAAATPN